MCETKGPPGTAESGLTFIVRAGVVRAVLLVVSVSTYLISPDDVVWRLIRTSPDARLWEHALFGFAAALLGIALLLKVNASATRESHDLGDCPSMSASFASLLQAIGIGSLLPLPGFLLLVFGDAVASLVLYSRHSVAQSSKAEQDSLRARMPLQTSGWRVALAAHTGLCFAFLSMAIFSVVLIDRVADALFAGTALVSLAANLRRFLRRDT